MLMDKRLFPLGTTILTGVVILGLIPIILRYLNGLGAISNLSDGRAWGLWISFDLYCGVALAAVGFTLAGAVYIFNLKKYNGHETHERTRKNFYLGLYFLVDSVGFVAI